MVITMTTLDGKAHEAKLPYDGAAHVDVGGVLCPHCGMPLRVRGTDCRIDSFDTYRADAVCAGVECGRRVGDLLVRLSTLFGIEEDERVLWHGRARVY